jgi:hypothetical protein
MLQFLAQDQQFKHLNDLHKERIFLRRLLYKKGSDDVFLDADFSAVLRLNGAGLFYAEQELVGQKNDGHISNVKGIRSQSSLIIEMLRKRIEQTYGQDYLLHRQKQITNDIKSLTPSHWPVAPSILSKDNFPPAINLFADSYADHLTGLLVIKVLMEQQPLRLDSFLVTHEALNREEREVLERLREQQILSLLKSVNSGRPDWGYAVLFNIY